jgi:outer membrane protein OmpA-like peptidoglycan-associated protein
LDQRTAENRKKDIKEVDARPRGHTGSKCQQSRIGAENRSRRQCMAGKPTGQLGEQQVYVIGEHRSNLDDYHAVTQSLVVFSFNDARLGAEAQQELDQLCEQLTAGKGYIVVVMGGTNNSCNEEYNYNLRPRRAEEVVRYLAPKYDVPAYLVHTIAMGPEKPVASNNTADGRKKNRRAEVQVISNTGTQPASKETSDDEDEVSQARLAKH